MSKQNKQLEKFLLAMGLPELQLTVVDGGIVACFRNQADQCLTAFCKLLDTATDQSAAKAESRLRVPKVGLLCDVIIFVFASGNTIKKYVSIPRTTALQEAVTYRGDDLRYYFRIPIHLLPVDYEEKGLVLNDPSLYTCLYRETKITNDIHVVVEKFRIEQIKENSQVFTRLSKPSEQHALSGPKLIPGLFGEYEKGDTIKLMWFPEHHCWLHASFKDIPKRKTIKKG